MDKDYGDEQRRARIYNERLLIDWRQPKPRYRPHWRAALAWLLVWALLIGLIVLLLRG